MGRAADVDWASLWRAVASWAGLRTQKPLYQPYPDPTPRREPIPFPGRFREPGVEVRRSEVILFPSARSVGAK